jgi:hypothetical protein
VSETTGVTFRGILPNTQTAISISGNGDGARVKIDVPQEDLAEVLKLVLYQGQLLKVTVEPGE